jgi:sugar O-acyltransferase (sialic acid O-acetyltransferase NeuD family)
MHIVSIPKDGASDENVTLLEMFFENGAEVKIGDVIYQYETSKAITDLESQYTGFIYGLIDVPAVVDVGSPICIITESLLSVGEISKSVETLIGKNVAAGANHEKIISKKALSLMNTHSIDESHFPSEIISEKMVLSYIRNLERVPLNHDSFSFSESDLIILGMGGHAGMCIDILKSEGKHDIVGFLDDDQNIIDGKYGYNSLGRLDNLQRLTENGLKNAIIGMGFIKNAKHRDTYFNSLSSIINIPTIIHKSSIIEPTATIGMGCQIMAGSIIGSNVTIEDNCIINSGAIISHDSIIKKSSHITPGAVLGGNVTIGRRSTIGMCTAVFLGVTIGDDVVIMNNQSVLSDVTGELH